MDQDSTVLGPVPREQRVYCIKTRDDSRRQTGSKKKQYKTRTVTGLGVYNLWADRTAAYYTITAQRPSK